MAAARMGAIMPNCAKLAMLCCQVAPMKPVTEVALASAPDWALPSSPIKKLAMAIAGTSMTHSMRAIKKPPRPLLAFGNWG